MKNTVGLPRVWVRSREERCQQDIKKSPFWGLSEINHLGIAYVQTTNLRPKNRKSLLHGRKKQLKIQTNSSDSIPQKSQLQKSQRVYRRKSKFETPKAELSKRIVEFKPLSHIFIQLSGEKTINQRHRTPTQSIISYNANNSFYYVRVIVTFYLNHIFSL